MDTATALPPLKFELAFLLGALVFGLLLLPVAIYLVGTLYFGEATAGGLGGFFGSIYAGLTQLDGATWFLVLSPYLLLQVLRGTLFVFRR